MNFETNKTSQNEMSTIAFTLQFTNDMDCYCRESI